MENDYPLSSFAAWLSIMTVGTVLKMTVDWEALSSLLYVVGLVVLILVYVAGAVWFVSAWIERRRNLKHNS